MPDIEERIIRLSEEDGRKLIERLKTQVNGHMTEVVRVNMNAPHEPDIYRLVPRSVAASSSSVVALAEQRAAVVQKRQPRLISVESDVEGHRLINVVAQTQQQLVDRFLRASSVATIRGSGIGGATNSKTSLMAPSSAFPYVTYGFGGQELGHHHHQQAAATTNTAAVKYEPTEPLLDDDANNETANARHQQEQYDCSYLMTSSGGRGSSRRLRMNAADMEDREDVKVGPSNTSREYDDARVAQQAVVAGDDDDLAGTCDYLSAKHIRKVCTCTRSRCLKLYCECFANGFFCKHCNCTNCANTLVHETERNEAILATLNRNSAAFRSKVAAIVKGSNAAQSSELVVDDAGVDDHHHHHRIADQGNSAGIGGLDTASSLDAAAAAAAKGGIVSSTATGHSGIFKQQTDELQYLRGCNCKKSNCLKNYCECYEARVPCGPYCKCDDCKNTDFGFYVFGDIAFREKPTVFLADVLKKARWLTVEGKKLGKCDSSYLNEELANIAIEGGCVLQPKHHHESDATSSVICEREHVIAFDPKNIMTFTHFSIADKISSYEFAANDNLCEDLVRCFVVRTTDSVMIDMADGTDATSKRQMAILTEFQHLLKTVLKKAKSYQALLSNEQRSIVQHCTTSHNQDDGEN